MSLIAHASVVLVLAFAWTEAAPQKVIDLAPMPVSLIHEPQPPAEPKPAPKRAAPHAKPRRIPVRTASARPKPHPRRQLARRTPPHPHDLEPLPAGDVQSDGSEVSEAELAGATSADSGPPGGTCDMARWLQNALRKDRLVQAAVAQVRRASSGGAIRVWNGEWIQSRGEDGKGLAAVREAMIWEIAFAPKACRTQPVRGLVLLSMNEGPGSARLAVGSGEWRWSDLLR